MTAQQIVDILLEAEGQAPKRIEVLAFIPPEGGTRSGEPQIGDRILIAVNGKTTTSSRIVKRDPANPFIVHTESGSVYDCYAAKP